MLTFISLIVLLVMLTTSIIYKGLRIAGYFETKAEKRQRWIDEQVYGTGMNKNN